MNYFSMIFGLLIATAGNFLMAQEVSVEEAQSRALDFLTNNTPAAKRAKGNNTPLSLSLAYTSRSESKTCFYVFNVGEDEGFVITGGDEAARVILGYCDHGSFDYDTAPENFKWWLGEYTNQIAHAELSAEGAAAASTPRRAKAAKQRESIGPLIKTKWGQTYPYNSEIPVYSSDGQPYVTGCVATAIAQVMNYWEYPVQGVGSYAYTYNGNTFSANFGATNYDWDNMLNRYSPGNYNETEAKAVGTLMYHVGVAADMQYGTSQSSAVFLGRIKEALISNFNYDPAASGIYRNVFFTDELWEDLIYDELNEGRPVLYAGANIDGSGSHAFICDGYDSETGMFSFNWGWNGSEDGFYTLSGVNAVNFWSNNQKIFLYVQPKDFGTNSYKPHLYVNSDYYLMAYYEYDDQFSFHYGDIIFDRQSASNISNTVCLSNLWIENRRSVIETYDLGVQAINTATGNVYYWTCFPTVSIPISTFTFKSLIIDPFDITTNGTYELRPVFRAAGDTDEDWHEMQPRELKTDIPKLTIIGNDGTEPVDIPFAISGDSMAIGGTLMISINGCNYTREVTYWSSNPEIATVDDDGLITGVSVGEVTISGTGEAQGSYKKTTANFDIAVKRVIKKEFVIGIGKTNLKINQNSQLSWPDDFDGEIIFESSDEKVATVDEGGLITAIDVGEVTITAYAMGSTNYFDKEFQFEITVFNHDLIFTEQPYINNDNNPYDGDPYVWFNIMNIGDEVNSSLLLSTPYEGYFPYDKSSWSTLTKSLPSGGMAKMGSNIIFSLDVDSVYTYYFYHDYECTQPWNYPSVTFTVRSRLTVDYSVGSSGYGTLILPFNQELPEGMKVYGCSGVDENGVLTLVEENSIRRNVPYIVQATPGSSYQFVGPKAIDADKPTFTNGILVGAVADNVPLNADTDYILQEQNGRAAFFKYTGTPSADPLENDNDGNRLAKPFRAFLRLDGANKAKLYLPGQIGDEGEGIEVIGNDNARPAGIYSIDGKRLAKLQKGLNVIVFDDGKTQKVNVK